jgi:hypothetical protein
MNTDEHGWQGASLRARRQPHLATEITKNAKPLQPQKGTKKSQNLSQKKTKLTKLNIPEKPKLQQRMARLGA